MDCFCQREVNSEWKGERKINRPLLYFAKKKKEKASEKVFFPARGCWFLAPMVSAPATGARQTQKSVFLHPDQADGSGIQLLNDDQGVMVLSTEQDG